MSSAGATQGELVENPATRVMGLGIGIFLIGFFSITLIVIFILTGPCSVRPQLFCRMFSTLALGVIILLLLFAPRQDQYQSTDGEIEEYDDSVIPRIAVVSTCLLFAIVAAEQFLKQHLMESKQLSNRNNQTW